MSRPSRARGLKLRKNRLTYPYLLSRPSRARGLKPYTIDCAAIAFAVAPLAGAWIETVEAANQRQQAASRPSRARGLKHRQSRIAVYHTDVAPLAGAWIETCRGRLHFAGVIVAPLAGAWIETRADRHHHVALAVAPLAGAWIETQQRTLFRRYGLRSRPSRARGLKLKGRDYDNLQEIGRAPRGRVD